MTWVPLASAVAGALIALSGTLLAELRRDRSQRDRDRDLERWQNCVAFALALDEAHANLRETARMPAGAGDRLAEGNEALHGSPIYSARERLLMSAPVPLVVSGEEAFLRLIAVRDVVRAGAGLQSPEYHRTYHPFAEAVWAFRLATRTAFGHRAVVPAALGRSTWSEEETCDVCGAARMTDQAPTA